MEFELSLYNLRLLKVIAYLSPNSPVFVNTNFFPGFCVTQYIQIDLLLIINFNDKKYVPIEILKLVISEI